MMIYYPLLLLNCTRHTMKMTFAFSHIKSAEGIGAVFFFCFFFTFVCAKLAVSPASRLFAKLC